MVWPSSNMPPFGVIGAITPVTHSLPTITGNAVNMIAGGNTLVVNPHPSGKRVAVEGVRRFNQAIYRDLGIDNLICVIAEPTLESADALFKHRGIKLICVTGGPAVARAAMQSSKRAIVAGPGNPPVVVDETADLARAARAMIRGASYDNNLLCIAEKEVFVVESVMDALLAEMERAGAVRLNDREISALTKVAIATVGEGEHRHDVAAKDFIGQDAAVLAAAAGRQIPAVTELVFGETDEANPFVPVEQMMPFLPFIPLPQRRRSDRQGEALRTRLPPHQHHPLEQCPQHDQDGPRARHHPVRQERAVHELARPGRRRVSVVLDRHADGRGGHDASDVHPRAGAAR